MSLDERIALSKMHGYSPNMEDTRTFVAAIERLTREGDEYKADYFRRHKDACDRYEEIVVLKTALAAAQKRVGVLEGAVDVACEQIKNLAIAGTEKLIAAGVAVDPAEKTYGPPIAWVRAALGNDDGKVSAEQREKSDAKA